MKLVSLSILVLATLALALAACGGATGDDAAGARPDDKAELAFARCMRAAGIDLPDPGTANAGAQRVRIGKGTSPQKLEEATTTCRKKTGGGPKPLTDEQEAEFRDAALKFAQCMRRNGVDVPDPETSSGGAIKLRKGGGGGGGPDIASPAFKRAQEECQKLLPGPKGAGKGGAAVTFSSRSK
jgi:hypothetical protein